MVIIKKIIWLDEYSKEAEVVIADNDFSLICFSHPFQLQEGDVFNDLIHCLDIENVLLSFSDKPMIKRLSNSYKHFIVGRLIDSNIVKVGELLIEVPIDYIPDDIKIGKYIEFNVSRLDLY